MCLLFFLCKPTGRPTALADPTMSNIKDSSDIEAASDLVLFVHREEVSNPETPFKNVTEIIWAKDRHNRYSGTEYLTVYKGRLVEVHPSEIARMEHINSEQKKPLAKGGF